MTILNNTITVGGDGEKYLPGIDHIAVQRNLIDCGPSVLKCFNDAKLPTRFLVSFQLRPAGMSPPLLISNLLLKNLKMPILKSV